MVPFAVSNLEACAWRLGARQFLVGVLIGLAPGLGAIASFSNPLSRALSAPSLINVVVDLGDGIGEGLL